jgi:hypothetical protein
MRALEIILVAPDALAPALSVEEHDDVVSALLPSGEYVIVSGGTHEERAACVAGLRTCRHLEVSSC